MDSLGAANFIVQMAQHDPADRGPGGSVHGINSVETKGDKMSKYYKEDPNGTVIIETGILLSHIEPEEIHGQSDESLALFHINKRIERVEKLQESIEKRLSQIESQLLNTPHY